MEADDVGVPKTSHDGDLLLHVGGEVALHDVVLACGFYGHALPIADVAAVVDFGEAASAEESA